MLTASDNALLTQVNGAPMGNMLRETCWFPVALSEKLVAGGAPLRFSHLGDNYVAFRTHDERVGVFDEHCPHRRASLALARNEDNALTCIFHGWKFSVTGQVLAVPTQTHNSPEFCKRVPLRHYPVREACGIVWAWLGSTAPAAFPDLEFMDLPATHRCVVSQKLEYNWVQDVEGGVDSAHVSILHQTWVKTAGIGAAKEVVEDLAPSYEFEPHPSGFKYAALRRMSSGSVYARVNAFVLPWFCMICPDEFPDGDRTVLISVPVDDTKSVRYMIRYNPHRPVKPSFVTPAGDPDNWPPLPPGNPEENWGQDRAAMAQGHFTGFEHISTEDFVVALSQGAIADRTREFLNSGDQAVMRARKLLLDAAKQFQAGEEPAGIGRSVLTHIRASADVISPATDWRTLSS